MQTTQRYWVVIPAAGVGKRMEANKPKQYIQLLGKTIIEHTLDCFISYEKIEKIIVVVSEGDPYWPELKISQHNKIMTVAGGQERCHSVLNGLTSLSSMADDNDWVMVHDAARPCIDIEDLQQMMDQLSDHPVGGILAYPVRDTMKRSDPDGHIIETVDRTNLWHAMTPQMFRLGKLTKALKSLLDSNTFVTDEAQAIESTSVKPLLITARTYTNKITHIGDLVLAEEYLKSMRKRS